MAIRTIPTLIIGLGGTGKRALTHLKRRIQDSYQRENLPWVRLLSIDTDDGGVSNPPVISQITGQQVHLGLNEMRIIDQSDTPKVISNLEAPENRHIREWYPDPGLNVDFPKAARGSGQVRMFGRVGLYKGENLFSTYRWLQQAAQEVSDPAAWDEYKGFAIDPGLQFVYVICSLCGGTGSGMFLDVAYMLRKIVGVDPSTRRFCGMMVLPEVYEPVVENAHLKRINANSYAALRELDYLMNSPRRSYKVRGKDHIFAEFERDVTPFDFAFLFGNKNKRGAVISQRQVSADKPMAADDRVCQYISEVIMTDVLSPVTERNESILSNIFTSIGEPEQLDDRILHKAFSAVGVASVKVPPMASFQDAIECRITDAVVDFLLRPDPAVTARALAAQFFNEHLSKVEEALDLRRLAFGSDPSYNSFLSRSFSQEFQSVERPALSVKINSWVERVLSDEVNLSNPLEIEKPIVSTYAATLTRFAGVVESTIRNYSVDPRYGYAFITEWLEELSTLARNKMNQVPPPREEHGNPKAEPQKYLDSLMHLKEDMQLPVVADTIAYLCQTLAYYYDFHAKEVKTHALIRLFYADLIKVIDKSKAILERLVATIIEIDRQNMNSYSEFVSHATDVGEERVLVDKSLIGRQELDRFLCGLLSPLWAGGKWEEAVPELSETIKQRIESELSYRLLEIESDTSTLENQRRQKIHQEIRAFVKQRIFDQLFPVDTATGRLKQPNYTDADGRSIIFEFGPENLLSMLVAHSSPLWFVQSHQVGSATSPVTFIGINGTKVPDKLLEEVQKQLPNFRPTDLVLSDVEPRIVVKQYDPLYSLASLVSIIDYENCYRATDRKQNPLHTDIRFTAEPNPFLQWLSYKSPEPPSLKLCSRGHDVTRALADLRQFCPDCFRDGLKTMIVPGKMICPKCNKVIAEGSRKCPECLFVLEVKKMYCPGCIAEGKSHPEVIALRSDDHGATNCPQCGALWSNSCPYCRALLENPTVCTRGSDRCIFDSPPIAQCHSCSCPVTPDTDRCPRCFKGLRECPECRKRNEPRRMLDKSIKECPLCRGAGDLDLARSNM